MAEPKEIVARRVVLQRRTYPAMVPQGERFQILKVEYLDCVWVHPPNAADGREREQKSFNSRRATLGYYKRSSDTAISVPITSMRSSAEIAPGS
jgi:hypothetical protein